MTSQLMGEQTSVTLVVGHGHPLHAAQLVVALAFGETAEPFAVKAHIVSGLGGVTHLTINADEADAIARAFVQIARVCDTANAVFKGGGE